MFLCGNCSEKVSGKALEIGTLSADSTFTGHASGDRIIRCDVTRHLKMLRDAPMAGLVKLSCGIVAECAGRLWAVHASQALTNLNRSGFVGDHQVK